MNLWVIILIVLAMMATFVSLIVGLVSFVRGGKSSPKKSNNMMQKRVYFQAAAIILIIIFILITGSK